MNGGNVRLRQAEVYRDTLLSAIGDLANGPDVAGSRARDDIMPGVRTLHVARRGRAGRHLLLYRMSGPGVIEIGRILHDRMDLPRHSPFPSEKGE
ncbi:type II toxin-antitoxin system RelE/ParE family toxin [Bradyrhizobium sp. ORS 285]|uniref:type II toxin-antitoxin system RelE/ParE family toxin n=1 Tax=Bradyrhizobium sp. ORS 285 TaxID=115808 RepID=UPI001FCCB023|nr:type II toxin-antitoxin system RelE/ParE family toxin [Bradyrhizobium sp. ORS 285]